MDEQALAALIDRIYGAAFDEAAWSGVIDELRQQFGASSATAMAWRRADQFPFLILKSNLDEAFSAKVEGYYHKIDPWLIASLQLRKALIITDDGIVPRDTYLETEMYQDFSRHYDIGKAIFAITDNSPQMMSSFNFYRAEGQADFNGEVRSRLQILAPHLKRGLRLYHQLTPLRARSAMFDATFEALGTAIFLLDETGRVLELNAQARALLAARAPMTVREGVLTASDPSDAARLSAIYARHRGGAGATPMPPPAELLLRAVRDGAPLRVRINPMKGERLPLWVDVGQRARVALLVTAVPIGPSIRSLVRTYGLTQAEAEIVLLLGEGKSAADIAARRSTRAGTVHSQIKQIYQKTGTTGHAQLIAKLFVISPAGTPQ